MKRAQLLRAVGLASLIWLNGCSVLREPPERVPSWHLTGTHDTTLGRAAQHEAAADGHSGVFALSNPLEAFAARMLLIEKAERSLDVQYYIWRGDITGTLLIDALKRAADRGVRVRLLLDDNGTSGIDDLLAALDFHDQVEVRLFNPYANRRVKALGYITHFSQLNRRMHNKALVADTQAAILGGRNIGDEYFGAHASVDFVDLDVLTAGPVATEVASAFDEYWNSGLSYPLSAVLGTAAESTDVLTHRVAGVRTSSPAASYTKAVRETQLAAQLDKGTLSLEWVPVRLIADPPEKAAGTADPSMWLTAKLNSVLGRAAHQVDLVSPYFVPGADGTALLATYPQNGVNLRIVTNSLAATDVAAVHTGYSRRRLALLRAGVRLYELKPDPDASARPSWRSMGSSAASLHGKTFSLDRARVYVGSFNIDPRSIRLNTELGLIIDSPALAAMVSNALDSWLPANAYELRLDDDQRIEWIEHTREGPVVHRKEPGAPLGRRLMVSMLSLLPIEWLL